ncbi:MAG: 30S ribosomal protein S12 methylthiotransferase RimO [Ruminococcaceae bacterium]|nr:30S ribosomal protein S12 methylthiotransferase RimO [Oscillospiraceae bacterium]
MNRRDKKVGFVSLGCAKNLCDTEVMLHHLLEAGYEITPEETDADCIIINTCAFIESAKKESIDSILDIAWLKEHNGLEGIVVCGCLAERYREELLSELPEIDSAVGIGSIHNIVEAVDSVFSHSEERYTSFEDKEKLSLGGDRIITTGETFAYLKVAEGCNNRCTYCAIPSIRGSLRSRTIEDIVEEAKGLDKMGIKELCVIAQDTSVYGMDIYGRLALPELLRAICDNTSIPWIRLLYCYPDKITDELISEMRDNPRIVNYIDLPIQHISDRMLTAMNRHGNAALIKETIGKLRREIPDIVIRSTAIVGFPGETEEDFEELCKFIKDVKFERFGAFTYSREEGTAAYDLPDQIDEQTKQDRYDILMSAQLDNSEKYNEELLGKVVHVLCEGFDPVSEAYVGRTYRDSAEIDGKVWFTSERKVNEGEFLDVRIIETMDYDLVGETVV